MLQWPHRCNYQTSDAALQCCDDWVQKRGAHSALLYSHESTCRMSCLALLSRSSARPCTALHAMPCQHLLPISRFLSSFAKVDRMRRLFRCIRAGLPILFVSLATRVIRGRLQHDALSQRQAL